MANKNNSSAIEELAASEGGVFTSAQAQRLGIPLYALSYAAKAGRIERLWRGSYRLAYACDDGLDELRAAYALTAPEKFSHERMADFDGVAVSGATAAFIHGIGDMYPSPYEFLVPSRFNSRHTSVSFSVSHVEEDDIIWKARVPVTRVEHTIAHLVRTHTDMSLVARVFVDAIRTYGMTEMNIHLLEDLLGADYNALLDAADMCSPDSWSILEVDQLGHVTLVGL